MLSNGLFTSDHILCSGTAPQTSPGHRRTSCSDSDHGGHSRGHTGGHYSLVQTSLGHTCTGWSLGPSARDLHILGHTASLWGQADHSPTPTSLSYRHRGQRCSIHGPNIEDLDSPGPGRTLPCIPSYRYTCHPDSVHGHYSQEPHIPRSGCCTPSPSSLVYTHILHYCILPDHYRGGDIHSGCRTLHRIPDDTDTVP